MKRSIFFFTIKTNVWCGQSCQVHKEKAMKSVKSSCECSCAFLFHSACMWAFKIVFFSHTIKICLMCFETWGMHRDSLTHSWLKVVSSSAHFPSLSFPPCPYSCLTRTFLTLWYLFSSVCRSLLLLSTRTSACVLWCLVSPQWSSRANYVVIKKLIQSAAN